MQIWLLNSYYKYSFWTGKILENTVLAIMDLFFDYFRNKILSWQIHFKKDTLQFFIIHLSYGNDDEGGKSPATRPERLFYPTLVSQGTVNSTYHLLEFPQ